MGFLDHFLLKPAGQPLIVPIESTAPTMSQNAALPAAVATPTPDGPPFTSLVTSMLSAWPDSALMPRSLAWANSGSSLRP